MSDLSDLATPFPDKYIHRNPSGGGSYVKHHTVTQRLLMVLGGFSWKKVEIVRGDVPAIPPDPDAKPKDSKRKREGMPALHNVITGVVWRLTATVDGELRVIEEAGDCEDPHNWPHDGARLKDAVSDAKKRCAKELGCGLHMWAQDEYFLDTQLAEQAPNSDEPDQHTDHQQSTPATGAPGAVGALQRAPSVGVDPTSETGPAVPPRVGLGDNGDANNRGTHGRDSASPTTAAREVQPEDRPGADPAPPSSDSGWFTQLCDALGVHPGEAADHVATQRGAVRKVPAGPERVRWLDTTPNPVVQRQLTKLVEAWVEGQEEVAS